MNLTLFDLDGTLLHGDSDHAFGEFLITLGWADAAAFRRRNDEFFADYQAGRLDIHRYVDFATEPWRERPPAALDRARARFMAEVVQPMLKAPALQLLRQHQTAGDQVAIVTATHSFITRPIATALEVQELIATELVFDAQAQATGAILGQPCFGAGKVKRVHDWLAARGQTWDSFERCSFYSDSTNDLPLLERVSHPVATNPSPALEQVAQQRGWPILKLFT